MTRNRTHFTDKLPITTLCGLALVAAIEVTQDNSLPDSSIILYALLPADTHSMKRTAHNVEYMYC